MYNLLGSEIYKKIKNTFFYFGATVINFIISIGTYPLFAKNLDVSEFAAFNYFNNYGGFFTFFFSLNLYMFFSAKYYKSNEEENEKLLKSLMIILLLWNLFALGIAYLFSFYFLNEWLRVKFNVEDYLLFSLASVSIGSLKSLYLISLRLKKKAFHFFLFSSLSRVFATLLGLYFVMYLEKSANSRFLGVLLTEVFSSLFVFYFVFKNGKFQLPHNLLKPALKFVWPLMLSSVVYYPLISLDQMILERYVNTYELGLYGIALNFAGYLHIFNFSIYQTIEPDIIKAKSENDEKALKKCVTNLLGLAIFSTLCYCLVSRYLISILSDNKFTDAYFVSNILSISYLFVLLFSVGNTLLTVEHKGKSVLLVNLCGLISILFFSILLSPCGSIGIAIARVISFAVLSLVSSAMILRNLPKRSL